jgi:hypothetical protein
MKKEYSRERALQRIKEARYSDPQVVKMTLLSKDYFCVEYQPELDKLYKVRRKIKKIWNEEADHNFWQDPSKVQCIHWIIWPWLVSNLMPSFILSNSA